MPNSLSLIPELRQKKIRLGSKFIMLKIKIEDNILLLKTRTQAKKNGLTLLIKNFLHGFRLGYPE